MKRHLGFVILLSLFALSSIAALWVYLQLPTMVPIHWGMSGEPNGYASKGWAVAFGPIALLIVFIIYACVPLLDPLRKNIEGFRRAYNGFFIALGVFLAYVFGLTLWYNLGHMFNIATALIPALGGLFFMLGTLLKSTKRNWFVGIRTPWTMESDIVWDKTHALGGILFRVLALVILACMFFPVAALVVLIGGTIGVALSLIVYSYLEFRKISK